MPRSRRRRQRGRVDIIKGLIERIKAQLEGSPLWEVGEKLYETITVVQAVPDKDINWQEFEESIVSFLDLLPEEFGPRFLYDARLIHAIKEQWSDGPAVFPDMVVPVYRGEWCYRPVPVPWIREPDGRAHHMYLVGIKEDEKYRIDSPPLLLDYSLMCHELAHYLLAKYGHSFRQPFEDSLDRICNDQLRRKLPLRGPAKRVSESRIKKIRRHWSVETGGAWSFEIAIDVISLWSCGPAYLDTLAHHLSTYENPFQIEPSHPPASLRADVLLDVAERLGWSEYIEDLQKARDRWFREGPPSFNAYTSLTNDDVVQACTDAALEYGREMKLPKLSPDDLPDLQNRMERGDELFGIDLIVGAWIVDRNKSQKEYETWEDAQYDAIANAINEE